MGDKGSPEVPSLGAAENLSIRIVTWNIHKGIGGVDRSYRLDRIVALLRDVRPDIAFLQEVADWLPRAKYHEQAEMIARSLELGHVEFAAEHRFRRGGYGNAILCRWPLTDAERIDLTVGRKKKRGALVARTRVRRHEHSRSVVLSNLHLGLAGSERGEQLRRFLATRPFAHTAAKTPNIVAGDLNDLWGTLGPKFLIPAGFTRAGPLCNTFPAWLPMRPLDGVFVRGEAKILRCMPRRSRLAGVASDHLPLVAEILLLPSLRETAGAGSPPASV